MMRPLTKSTRTLVSADHVPSAVREAFRRAEEERPGATHLELPEDVARESSDVSPLAPNAPRRPVADEASLALAAEAIASARRPLLMIGAGANRKLTSEMLRVFVDRVGIPFFSTQMGKGVVDETHPLWMGTAALSDGDFVHRAIEASDCIINVGHDVIEKPPFVMRDNQRTVVHLNFSSAEVDPVYFPQVQVTGDIANAVWRLAEGVGSRSHWDFSPFERARAGLDAQLARGTDDERFPIYPARLVARARALRAGDPRDEATTLGPMIDEPAARRLEGWIQSAVRRGARVLTGGGRRGALLEATVLEGVPADEPLCVEEAFGPVVLLQPFLRFEDALRTVNDGRYGLQAGLFTQDLSRAMRAWDELEVGGVVVGDVPSFRVDTMPYGGVKGSGLGREGVKYAIEDMTELRLLVLRQE
jgi:hypothetical protein